MSVLIELKPTKLFAVKIPNDIICAFMGFHKDTILYQNKAMYDNKEYGQINLPPKSKFRLIEQANKLSKEDLKDFIFSHGQRSGLGGLYYSYPRFDNENPELGTSSITHSFQCLMYTNGLYEKEKYGVGIIEKDNYAILTPINKTNKP